MQLLYHCNLGMPFLEPGSRVQVPIKEMSPLTSRAAEGIDAYDQYAPPVAGFAEQVYAFEPLADDHGRTLAMLYTAAADKGIVLHSTATNYPASRFGKTPVARRRLRHGTGAGDEFPQFQDI